MESLNGHEAGNGGYGQGRTYGNSPFLDPTAASEVLKLNHLWLIYPGQYAYPIDEKISALPLKDIGSLSKQIR
jgi:hypothetical protein